MFYVETVLQRHSRRIYVFRQTENVSQLAIGTFSAYMNHKITPYSYVGCLDPRAILGPSPGITFATIPQGAVAA